MGMKMFCIGQLTKSSRFHGPMSMSLFVSKKYESETLRPFVIWSRMRQRTNWTEIKTMSRYYSLIIYSGLFRLDLD